MPGRQQLPQRARGVGLGWLGFTVLVIAPVLALAGLVVWVVTVGELPFDVPGLLALRAMATPSLDGVFLLITRFGYEWGVIPADIGIVVLALVFRRWREAAFAASSFLGSALLTTMIKRMFERPRPDLWESLAPEGTFSFPSAHAAGSLTLVMVCLLLFWGTRARYWVLAGGGAFALLVGLSRPYLGVHFPSDILAGWCVGLVVASGFFTLFYRHHVPWQPSGGALSVKS